MESLARGRMCLIAGLPTSSMLLAAACTRAAAFHLQLCSLQLGCVLLKFKRPLFLHVGLCPSSSLFCSIFGRRATHTCVITVGRGEGEQIAVYILTGFATKLLGSKGSALPKQRSGSACTLTFVLPDRVSSFTWDLGPQDISLTSEGLETKVNHTGSHPGPSKILDTEAWEASLVGCALCVLSRVIARNGYPCPRFHGKHWRLCF